MAVARDPVRVGTGVVHQLVSKVRRNLRDVGVAITLKKSLGYVLGFLYGTTVYRIYMIDLAAYRPKSRDGRGFTYKVICEKDADCIRQIEKMEEWLEGNVAKKIAGGAVCLVAMDNCTVAGFNIAAFGEVEMPLVRVRRKFPDDSAWSEQITVHNNYRGKGLGSELRYRMFEELKGRGYRRFFGGTLSNNVANLKLSRKVGFREIADIRYRRVLGTRQWRVDRVRDRVRET